MAHMFEAKIASPIQISITSLGFYTIEKQVVVSILFGLIVYLGALYSTNPMILTETSYEEAKALIAVKGCEEISFLSYQPYLKLRSEFLSRRVSSDTIHRLANDGCRMICGLDATSIALSPIGFLAGLGMFRFLIAAELALLDVREGNYSRSKTKKRSFTEGVHALHSAVFSAPIRLLRRIKMLALPFLITFLVFSSIYVALLYAAVPFYPAETSYREAAKLVRSDPKQNIWLQSDAFPVLKSSSESIGRRISLETCEKLRAKGIGAVAVDSAASSIAILIPLFVLTLLVVNAYLKQLLEGKETRPL